MMGGWDNGMGGGGWILMILTWIVFIALIVWAIARLFPALSGGDGRRGADAETPREVLDRRLARGEIDVDEHRRLREALMPTHEGRG